MKRFLSGLPVVVCALATASSARATPRPLPFTYTTETLGQGELEVEQYVDMTPVKVLGSDGNSTSYVSSQFQSEFEYGITDRLELGLYVVYVPGPPAGYSQVPPMTETTGAKERLRYVFADPGAWPIDVGVYGEIVEGQTEEELEVKVLLQRRFGKLRVDANLWGEIEYELTHNPSTDYVINPTAGATYEITPAVHLGLEGWMRLELPTPAPNTPLTGFGGGSSFGAAYVGPAVLFNLGKLWWSTGLYARVTDIGRTVDPTNPSGDVSDSIYGPIWGRMVLGYEL